MTRDALSFVRERGVIGDRTKLVERCVGDYAFDGWTSPSGVCDPGKC